MKILSKNVLVIAIFFLVTVTEIHASIKRKRQIPIQVVKPSSSPRQTSMSHRSSSSSSSRRSSSSGNSGKSDSIPVEVVQPTESTPSSSPPSSSPPSPSSSSKSESSESGSSESGSSDTSMTSSENSSGGSSGSNNEKNHSFSQLAESLGNIPFIGFVFKILLNYFGEYYMWLDQLTNGLLARILGGSLPCVISMEQDIVCSGTSKNGGVFGIVQSIILGLPSTILPDFLKSPILLIIKIFINPIMDTLFGGLPEPEKM